MGERNEISTRINHQSRSSAFQLLCQERPAEYKLLYAANVAETKHVRGNPGWRDGVRSATRNDMIELFADRYWELYDARQVALYDELGIREGVRSRRNRWRRQRRRAGLPVEPCRDKDDYPVTVGSDHISSKIHSKARDRALSQLMTEKAGAAALLKTAYRAELAEKGLDARQTYEKVRAAIRRDIKDLYPDRYRALLDEHIVQVHAELGTVEGSRSRLARIRRQRGRTRSD